MNEIPLTTAQSDNRTKVVSEALRHTEMRLQDLEAFASNADRRATAFATTSAAVAAIPERDDHWVNLGIPTGGNF